MKIYFGKIDQETIDQFGVDGAFEHEGEFYWFQMEYGTNPGGMDEVAITDTCGRYLPMPLEYIEILQNVMNVALLSNEVLEQADTVLDNLSNEDLVIGFGS